MSHPFGLLVPFCQSIVRPSFFDILALSFNSGLELSFYYKINTPPPPKSTNFVLIILISIPGETTGLKLCYFGEHSERPARPGFLAMWPDTFKPTDVV